MCGIVGITSNKEVTTRIVNSLKKLEYRGYDSAGIATLNDGFIKEFYPKVAYIGYEQAFLNAFGLTLDEFYEEFGLWFDQTSKSEKLKIIDVISKY